MRVLVWSWETVTRPNQKAGAMDSSPPAPRTRLLPLPTTLRIRHASRALKMACPFCAASESSVVRSRGAILLDQVHRRRQCICTERFPTFEQVDWAAFAREHPELAAELPPSWDEVNRLLHQAWGHAVSYEYVKEDWMALQAMLQAMQRLDPRAQHLRS